MIALQAISIDVVIFLDKNTAEHDSDLCSCFELFINILSREKQRSYSDDTAVLSEKKLHI